jgi:hypothetical protein
MMERYSRLDNKVVDVSGLGGGLIKDGSQRLVHEE